MRKLPAETIEVLLDLITDISTMPAGDNDPRLYDIRDLAEELLTKCSECGLADFLVEYRR